VKNTARKLLIELKAYVGNTSKNEKKIEKTLKIQLGKNLTYRYFCLVLFLSSFDLFSVSLFLLLLPTNFLALLRNVKKKQKTFF